MPRRSTPPAPSIPVDRARIVAAQALSVRLSALSEAAAAMQRTRRADELLRTMERQARWLLDFQHCAVALRAGSQFLLVVLRGEQAGPSTLPTGTLARALGEGRPVLSAQPLPGDPDGMQSALALPLLIGESIGGALAFYHDRPGHYTTDDLRIAAALTTHLGLLLHNAELLAATARARDELHTVLESIEDAVLVLTPSGRVTMANRAFSTLLGVSAASLAGARALRVLRGSKGGPALVSREAARAFHAAWSARPNGASGTLELSDGRWLEWKSAGLTNLGAGYVVTLRDISERVKLEELRQDMAHMLVHDLRTPLTSLLMGLDMLSFTEAVHASSEAHELARIMFSSATQMLNQVNTILDVSKLEEGRLAFDLVPLPVRVIAEKAMARFEPIAQQQDLRVELQAPSALPSVYGDAEMLRRVFENLLGNALKWAPRSSTVTIELRADDAAVTAEVRDKGPGVPPELVDRIFEKYGGASRRERRPGTGLGLAFCKLVVEAHGGSIGVRAAPGGGSVFWFRLPPGETSV